MQSSLSAFCSNSDLLQSFPEKYSSGELPLTQEIAGLRMAHCIILKLRLYHPMETKVPLD